MGQVKVLERLANTREISRTPSPHSSRPPSTSHESEPPPSQESSHRSSVRTSPPPSSHQQQGQQQQSMQVQNQTQGQQTQQVPQQQAQQPLPHPGMPKVSYLPRNSISAGETLPEETSNPESENELRDSVHEGISTLEEEGSAACVVSQASCSYCWSRTIFLYIYISKGNNGKNATKLLLTTFVVCNFSHNSEDLKQKQSCISQMTGA